MLCVFTATFCLSGGVFVASCDDVDNPWITLRLTEKNVVAATVGETSYLVAVSSLDEGTVSNKEKVPKVIGGTYWVYKGLDYVFALVYNKGGCRLGAFIIWEQMVK